MDNTLLEQGLDLMLYGMGSVLVFLTLLVLATVIMSALMTRFFSEPEPEVPERGDSSDQASPPGVDDRVLAIIKSAVEQHRSKRRK